MITTKLWILSHLLITIRYLATITIYVVVVRLENQCNTILHTKCLLLKILVYMVYIKITKFVDRISRQEKESLETEPINCFNSIKPYTEAYRIETVNDTNESRFNLELHSGCALNCLRNKAISCSMHSTSNTTHYYIITNSF